MYHVSYSSAAAAAVLVEVPHHIVASTYPAHLMGSGISLSWVETVKLRYLIETTQNEFD